MTTEQKTTSASREYVRYCPQGMDASDLLSVAENYGINNDTIYHERGGTNNIRYKVTVKVERYWKQDHR